MPLKYPTIISKWEKEEDERRRLKRLLDFSSPTEEAKRQNLQETLRRMPSPSATRRELWAKPEAMKSAYEVSQPDLRRVLDDMPPPSRTTIIKQPSKKTDWSLLGIYRQLAQPVAQAIEAPGRLVAKGAGLLPGESRVEKALKLGVQAPGAMAGGLIRAEPISVEELGEQPGWMQALQATVPGMGLPAEGVLPSLKVAKEAARVGWYDIKAGAAAPLPRVAKPVVEAAEVRGISVETQLIQLGKSNRYTLLRKGEEVAELTVLPTNEGNLLLGILKMKPPQKLNRALLRNIELNLAGKAQASGSKYLEVAIRPSDRGIYEKAGYTFVSPRIARKSVADILAIPEVAKPPVAPPIKAAKRPVPAAAKEPWQMTNREYVDSLEFAVPGGETAKHVRLIEKALKEKKPVPPEVLADYPDLVSKAAKPTVPERLKAMAQPEAVRPPIAPPTIAPERALVPSVTRDWATAKGVLEIESATKATQEQIGKITYLARQKLLLNPENKPLPQYRHFAKAYTGKTDAAKMTQAEADRFIEALNSLQVKGGRPPKIPSSTGIITEEFAHKIPQLKEIGILEKVRPTREVWEKIGLRKEIWEPAFATEIETYAAMGDFKRKLTEVSRLVGKDPESRKAIFEALENPKLIAKLKPNEQEAAAWFKKNFDDWADRLKLPPEKRITNYVTHIFEQQIAEILKARHPLDPELIKALDWITPKTVFNPFLQARLGQKIGLRMDPFAAAEAYEARALRTFHYEPLLKRIRVYEPYLPPNAARYLRDFTTRLTNRPLAIDREVNQTLKEFAQHIQTLPGGKVLAQSLTRGNASGMLAYNYTSLLYFLWLGFKPTSAIRNLSQHLLALAEVGPVNLAKGIGLRFAQEGKEALAKSTVWASRKQALVPGIDSTFVSRWTDKVRETSLWMFRKADEQNVKDAFLSGYAEARGKGLPIEWAIKRGDEVASNTQFIYSKMGSSALGQNAIGRVLSPLTTWPENFMELLSKQIAGTESYVFREFAAQTGKQIAKENPLLRRKAILLYAGLVAAAYEAQNRTRYKAQEYTGWTSIQYLTDIAKGELPALEIPGAMAELVGGALLNDTRMLKAGWSKLQKDVIPGIIGRMEDIAEGDKDWLTAFLFMNPEKKGWDFVPEVSKELKRLDIAVGPVGKTINKMTLSPKQIEAYQQYATNTINQYIQAVMNDSRYQMLDTTAKGKVLRRAIYEAREAVRKDLESRLGR